MKQHKVFNMSISNNNTPCELLICTLLDKCFELPVAKMGIHKQESKCMNRISCC